jgi:hypothetical protein
VDPDRRHGDTMSVRTLAAMVEEIDTRSSRDVEEVLMDLLWMAWPSARSQDQ